MATSERADRPAWQILVALAGAATAIVIVVYLIGGAIVWERLHVLRLPANQAVAPLPRNLLLIDGVRALAWPVTLGLVAAGLVILLANILRFGPRVTHATWAAFIVLCIAASVAVALYDTGPQWQHAGFLTSFAILVAAAVAAARWHLVAIRRVALGAAVAMAAIGFIVVAADVWRLPVRLEYAQVRFVHGGGMKGFYIGATSDAIYLAPNHTCHVGRRILALPQSRVKSVVVFTSTNAWPKGARPGKEKCKTPP